MEARQTLRGNVVPKALLFVLAMCAAVALAAAGSFITKDLTSSSAGVNSAVHPAAGTVLRQDNPVQAAPSLIDRGAELQSTAPAGTHVGRSSGNQSIGGPADTQTSGAKDISDRPGFRA